MQEVFLPKLGQTMEEAEIARWLKAEGERVKRGEVLLEITTDKATLEVESYFTGTLRKILAREGETLPVGTTIALVGDADEPIPEKYLAEQIREKREKVAPRPETLQEEKAVPGPGKTRILVSPRARRLAKEKGVELDKVKGSGPGGRITEKDVMDHVQGTLISPMRRILAQRMSQSKREIPHFYISMDVDMSRAVEMREELKKKGEEISFSDLFIRASGLALKEFTGLNVEYTEAGIRQREEIDIGLAVAVDEGVLAPVVRGADKKALAEIAEATRALIEEARTKRLTPDEYQGGSLTISNLGMFGIKNFIPIISPGQAAILGAGQIEERPVVHSGKIEATKMMTLVLAADHRLTDGVAAANFLGKIKELLENPQRLL